MSLITSNAAFLWLVLLLSILSLGWSAPAVLETCDPTKTLIQEVFNKIGQYQIKEDTPYIPFQQWKKQKGVYSTTLGFNFHGSPEMAQVRREFSIHDNTPYTALFIISQMFEAMELQGALMPDKEEMQLAVEMIFQYYDINRGFTNSILTYWPFEYDEEQDFYRSTPYNLLAMFNLPDTIPFFQVTEFLRGIGMTDLSAQLETMATNSLGSRKGLLNNYFIASDFDDTFLHLAVGSYLYKHRDRFPEVWQIWSSKNTNLTSVLDALKTYAYRPFSSDPNRNSILPTSYYWLRDFLQDAKEQRKDLALAPVWVLNLEEQRDVFHKGVTMPLQANNIDAAVSMQVIYGISMAIMNGLMEPEILDDPQLQQIFHNTTQMAAYLVRTNMTSERSGRPDLTVGLWPSNAMFSYIVSRVFSGLHKERAQRPLPRPIMEEVYWILRTVLENEGTANILSKVRAGEDGMVYFDDFLGKNDTTFDGEPLDQGDDRIYNTALTINMLLNIWTESTPGGQDLKWRPGAPSEVRPTVEAAAKWLTKHALDPDLKPFNAMYDLGLKEDLYVINWFPANRFTYINGTDIEDWTQIPEEPFVLVVEGYIEPEDYEVELNKLHFGREVPRHFNGLNEGNDTPFFTCIPFTYSTVYLALLKYSNVRT